jgi:hypothetical protein
MRINHALPLLVLMPAITLAQAPEGPGVQLDPRARLVTESRGANNGLGADGNPLSIEAGQADGKGEIAIKLPTCKSGDEGLPILKHVLKITAPTDKNSEITDFTNVDGLAKDLTVGYSFRTLLTTESSIEELMDDFDGFVLEHEELTGVNDLGEINELVQKMDVEEQERWRDIYAAAGRSSISWFVDGSLSHNQYEFFDQDQAEQDANKMGISLKTGLSFPLRPGRLSFAVGFQRAFKDNDTKAQVCTEVEDAPGFESCKELLSANPMNSKGRSVTSSFGSPSATTPSSLRWCHTTMRKTHGVSSYLSTSSARRGRLAVAFAWAGGPTKTSSSLPFLFLNHWISSSNRQTSCMGAKRVLRRPLGRVKCRLGSKMKSPWRKAPRNLAGDGCAERGTAVDHEQFSDEPLQSRVGKHVNTCRSALVTNGSVSAAASRSGIEFSGWGSRIDPTPAESGVEATTRCAVRRDMSRACAGGDRAVMGASGCPWLVGFRVGGCGLMGW